ncbi:MAG: alanine--tRNA ligase-related protein, partial [Candidatus Nanohaloarchaeota archaeon QJJ-5]|nr:alanine--tRNA ligase-related protein [Candidatus Nanohaloarchaeota archaeon QJJ-5]
MPTLEDLKDTIEQEAAAAPEKFFAVDAIKDEGFDRYQCSNCDRYFWSTTERDVCGEPSCDSGYTFINDPPTDKTFSFETAWTAFSAFMEERGYTPINRYPLAARWRDDTEFVRASIYDFQPYVVSGEVDPPANPLVVPQFCARFNDIDNVGITGRHYTGFIMTGQHAFTDPDAYDQDKYFRDMLAWMVEGMAIPKDEIILHEDSWGGGGNLGACMEFFVDGLELFNQVYMFYEVDDSAQGYSELDTKVLDMGMGHERVVWLTHGSETSYEANMPEVIERLYETTGVTPDKDIWRKFLPYSGLLNMDEVDDIEATWQHIADEIDVDKKRLKQEIEPAAALYSIADHTRTLLIALSDGMLPSNSGERHTLRVITRRCLDFIEQYDWDLDLTEIVGWHAASMNGVYPELEQHLDDVKTILEHEQQKYDQMVETAQRRIETLEDDDIDDQTLIELYDSHGISPEMLERAGFAIEKPEDFYTKVAERHEDEKTTDNDENDTIPLPDDVEPTRMLFRDDETQKTCEATVQATISHDGSDYVILDQTCFYPTSGGQQHDTGRLGESDVIDVIKQDGIILHEVDDLTMDVGDTISGTIDWDRREQLMHHHTATHLINGAARDVLGNHVWQAGAKKTEQKGRLDISHFDTLSDEQL